MGKKTLFFLFFAASLAASAGPGDEVNPVVQQKFHARFGASTEVKWKKVQDVYIGQFILNFESMDCYINDRGELLGTGRYFATSKIDEKTKAALHETFDGWFIQQAYECSMANELPQQMFILSNFKYTAIVRVSLYGSIEVLEKKKSKLFNTAQLPAVSAINSVK